MLLVGVNQDIVCMIDESTVHPTFKYSLGHPVSHQAMGVLTIFIHVEQQCFCRAEGGERAGARSQPSIKERYRNVSSISEMESIQNVPAKRCNGFLPSP